MLARDPMSEMIAGVSVGVVSGSELLDLNYDEDSRAAVDMNLILTDSMKYVEVQGTAEAHPFDEQQFAKLIGLGKKGLRQIFELQREALGE